jgi:hypothetical protein
VPKPTAYARDWRTPTSFGHWGASAADRARLAWALARRIDPDPYWIQLIDPAGPHDAVEMPVVSQIPSDHVFLLDPARLAPQPELGNITSWVFREDLEADARLRTLVDFVRLPAVPRELVAGHGVDSPTRALVIAESALAADLYSAEPHGIRPFVEAINQFSTTIIFAAGPSDPRYKQDIDYVFRLDARGGRSPVTVECERGPSPAADGLFSVGYRRELNGLIGELGGS